MSDPMFRGLRVPSPPPELRASVLAAARDEIRRPAVDPWRRLLASPLARMAWAAGVAGLLLAHTFLSLRAPAPRPTVRLVPEEESERLVALPRVKPLPVPPGLEELEGDLHDQP